MSTNILGNEIIAANYGKIGPETCTEVSENRVSFFWPGDQMAGIPGQNLTFYRSEDSLTGIERDGSPAYTYAEAVKKIAGW